MFSQNINQWFNDEIFTEAINYARKHSEVPGVKDIMKQIEKVQQDYYYDKTNFINQNKEEMRKLWEVAQELSKNKKICRNITIVILIPLLFAGQSIFMILLLLAFVCGLIITIVFKITEKRKWEDFNNYTATLKNMAHEILYKYGNKADSLYNDIDDLFLSSLDPVLRENVLLRRDRERQHQEMLNMQNQYQEALMKEQKQIRATQEKLLEIERKREAREEKNRYY